MHPYLNTIMAKMLPNNPSKPVTGRATPSRHSSAQWTMEEVGQKQASWEVGTTEVFKAMVSVNNWEVNRIITVCQLPSECCESYCRET